MLVVIIGLAGALATLVAYSLLTDRLDVTSLRRRQLDSWASLLALAWLAGIAYGGAVVQTTTPSARPADPGLLTPDLRPLPILRLTQPSLGVRGPAKRVQQHANPTRLPTSVVVAQGLDVATEIEEREAAAQPALAAAPPQATAQIMPDLATELPRVGVSTLTWQRAVATEARAPVVITRVPALLPTVGIVPTASPTLPPPPTSQPEPPAPTPQCGDPKDIRLQVRFDDASADNNGRGLAVRYHIRVQNDSAFPVNLAEGVLTALSQGPGSEQFGSRRLDEVVLAAHAVYELDGSLNLDRRPSPMTRTDLCMSFVPDTCGQREPYRVFRRCTTVHGF